MSENSTPLTKIALKEKTIKSIKKEIINRLKRNERLISIIKIQNESMTNEIYTLKKRMLKLIRLNRKIY